ncbi:SPOR domain-containing protein [Spirosoma montaniterrae]|uniref:SPOR domain-containing protein n=1 Tax=Spirosoma montaniterrae TaxID=1178516 RepID=UPI001E564FC6|nr:SPOR domain-containing protein [Spirosoma montaniterrae]
MDDGILANYIMLHEPLTREGAQRHISLFVNELRQQVQQTGCFDIDGIGMFTQNDEGRLQFEPGLRHNFFGEAYGMNAVEAQLLNRQPAEEPVFDAVPVTTALGPVLVRDEETTLVPYRPARPYWRVAAAALLVGSLGLVSYFSVIKPGQPLQSSLDPAGLLRIPATLASYWSNPRDPNETRKPVVIRPVTPKPAVAVAVTAEATPAPKPVEKPAVTPAPVSKPNVVAAPVVKPASAPVAMAKPVTKPARTGPFFTVIAGSFANKPNALRLRRQLRKVGFADAYIIPPTRRNKLYKVAASGSGNIADALTAADSISTFAKTTAWIMRN